MNWLITLVSEYIIEAIAIWITELVTQVIFEWMAEVVTAAVAEWLNQLVAELSSLLRIDSYSPNIGN